ncbi:MAG: DUF433 domain-containing protein [Pirellulales bacterium]
MTTPLSELPDWRRHIVSTPDVLRGKPRIVDTRIPVALVLGYLASGADADEIIAEFPDLRPEHIRACLDYARELAEFEVAGT